MNEELSPPLRAPLSLRALAGEFLDHGRLVSTAAFALDPHWDIDAALAHGWQRSSLEPGPSQQLEREVLLRHRGGWRSLTLKPFYLRGRYLGTNVDLRPGVALAQVLPWLAGRRPAATLEWFHFAGADQGAVLADGRIGFHFLRRGRRFVVTGFDAGITAPTDDPDLPGGLDNAKWLRSLMSSCDDPARWCALAAQDADPRAAAQALRAIVPYLRGGAAART